MVETVVTTSGPSPADTRQATSLTRDRWASRSELDEDLPFALPQGVSWGALSWQRPLEGREEAPVPAAWPPWPLLSWSLTVPIPLSSQIPEEVWGPVAGRLPPQMKLQPLGTHGEGGASGDGGQREEWVLVPRGCP